MEINVEYETVYSALESSLMNHGLLLAEADAILADVATDPSAKALSEVADWWGTLPSFLGTETRSPGRLSTTTPSQGEQDEAGCFINVRRSQKKDAHCGSRWKLLRGKDLTWPAGGRLYN